MQVPSHFSFKTRAYIAATLLIFLACILALIGFAVLPSENRTTVAIATASVSGVATGDDVNVLNAQIRVASAQAVLSTDRKTRAEAIALLKERRAKMRMVLDQPASAAATSPEEQTLLATAKAAVAVYLTTVDEILARVESVAGPAPRAAYLDSQPAFENARTALGKLTAYKSVAAERARADVLKRDIAGLYLMSTILAVAIVAAIASLLMIEPAIVPPVVTEGPAAAMADTTYISSTHDDVIRAQHSVGDNVVRFTLAGAAPLPGAPARSPTF